MRLKKLELYGFKSFAQRTEIVFTDGITGIVGPNGSGKSNIGDAVRWVLGEQSAKTLRGASMSDVIFGGTQKRKPLTYCEVSLVFDNEDRALPMDFAEVMVTRRVYRSGESEYYLNQSACRLKDVVDLFRDTGIGKEGYSLIGQGRIDEILSRRSEDRRQIFEEAAGIVKFKVRKEEADRKLAHTLENADRIDDILEELTRQLGPLEEQSKSARIFLELSAELKVLDLNLFLHRSAKAQEKLAELDAELMNLQTVVAQAEEALAEKNQAREVLQAALDELEDKLSRARETMTACIDLVHEAENREGAIRSRREARGEERERFLTEQAEAEERLAALRGEAGDGGEALEKQAALVAEAERLTEQARTDAARTRAAQEEAEAALEAHKQQVLDSINREAARRNSQTRLHTMRTNMTERLTEIEAAAAALAEEEAHLAENAGAAARLLAEEEERRAACEAALAENRDAVTAAGEAVTALRDRRTELTGRLQQETTRHKVLTEMTREMEGYNQSVRRAVQYAKNRGLPGVRGVLAQLIRVPREYETAIDMALGAAQQNIVTDTEETAKELIAYLRENRLGRATFLPLSAIRGKGLNAQERTCLRMKGCLGVASDLIDCDPAFRPIVENLLGRTLIAQDLDAGIPIMRAGGHSFRLVTLKGDVMHSGGSMTGGSTQSGGAGLLSRARELQELGERIHADKAALEALEQEVTAALARRDALREAGAEALEALHRQEIAVAREQERCDGAADALAAQRGRIAETASACEQLREAIADIDAQLTAAETEDGEDSEALEHRTADFQQAVYAARKAAADAADTVMTRTLQLSDLRHSLEALQRDSDRRQEEIGRLTGEQARRAERLSQMLEQDAQDAAEIAQAEADAQARRQDRERQEDILRDLEEHRRAAQERHRDLSSDIESLHTALTRDGERIHRSELTRSRVDNDLRVLQDRIWNTYELTYAGAEEFRQTEGFSVQAAEHRAAELNRDIRALGDVNVHAVEQYAETKARFDDLSRQQDDLRRAEKDLRELIERLLDQMKSTFTENFTLLQGYFQETFVRLFGGGHAELSLLDPSDPLNCGIEVNVQPPGKKLQLLSLLSGGERALTAIAILFAMLKLKPTPFCILDEIEAALDDANIAYFADYLAEYSRDTQFVVVTHRKGTMERCNALYGVAMEEQGVSKMVSVSLQDYKE